MPTDYICLDYLKVGAANLIPGDRIDIDALLQRQEFSERLVAQLTERQRIGKLSLETFQVGLARRVHGAPWPPVGFTEAFLLEKGVLTEDQIPGAPEKPKAEPGKPAAAAAKRITEVTLGPDKIAVGPYFVQPRKSGNFTTFDVCDAEGKLLRDKGFKNKGQALSFLEDLYTKPPSTDNSAGDDAETGHGDDLQPQSGDAEGSDSPADR